MPRLIFQRLCPVSGPHSIYCILSISPSRKSLFSGTQSNPVFHCQSTFKFLRPVMQIQIGKPSACMLACMRSCSLGCRSLNASPNRSMHLHHMHGKHYCMDPTETMVTASDTLAMSQDTALHAPCPPLRAPSQSCPKIMHTVVLLRLLYFRSAVPSAKQGASHMWERTNSCTPDLLLTLRKPCACVSGVCGSRGMFACTPESFSQNL